VAQALESLREAYAVLNRDFDLIKGGEYERMLGFFDPECEIHPIEGWPIAVYRGHEGYKRFFADTFGEFERVRCDVHQYIEGDGDVIVALTTTSGFSVAVQAELAVSATVIHEMRGERILRQRNYADRRRGLEIAGIPDPLGDR
jgi:ketosteroid isomerase-like protein